MTSSARTAPRSLRRRLRLATLVVASLLSLPLASAAPAAEPSGASGAAAPTAALTFDSPVGPTAAPSCTPVFTDVLCGQAFFDEITWLALDGVVNGYGDGTFRPTATVTRQAVAAFFYRVAGSPDGPFPDPGFADVAPGHPFYTAIAWFADNEYTTGYGDGTFRPTATVTRQAVAAFMWRYAGSPAGPFPDPGFVDVPAGHPFYRAIGWVASVEVTLGYGDGTFRPVAGTSRQAVAAFLHRLVGIKAPCDDLDPRHCFLPFPSNNFARRTLDTPTGLQLDLDPAVMPANDDGVRIDPTEWNRQDGVSPGTTLMAFVPGVDLDQTGFTRITDMSTFDAADAPLVVINADTGERWPVWAELDVRATSDNNRLLIARPARNFEEGQRYIVALRNMRDAGGSAIAPSTEFANFRDGVMTDDPATEVRRGSMEKMFQSLEAAGVPRGELYLAWDFTVASQENLTERLLHMRDESFAALGADAPAFAITSDVDFGGYRIVKGTYEVPRYYTGNGANVRLNYGPDGLPEPVGTYSSNLECVIPDSATSATPARLVLYQHGLLGDASSVGANMPPVATTYNIVACGTDWIGMSKSDQLTVAAILKDLSRFAALPDRSQQGILNVLFLGRLMRHPDGLASDPAFQDAGQPAIVTGDASQLAFNGNSQGGIMGGAATAVSNEWERAFLGVPGQNFSTLLRRSVYWARLVGPFLNYSDEVEVPIGLAFIQMLWDRSESNGYAPHIAGNPLPGTIEHKVLLFEAFGDHQVANLSTENMARTMGIPIRTPALAGGRSNLTVPFFDLDPVPAFPYDGSALVVWDFGTPAPPITNTQPTAGSDPHGAGFDVPEVVQMGFDFLKPGGVLNDVCAGVPCTTP